MQDLPRQTTRIFEILSKGYFVNSNSNDSEQRELYTIIDEHSDQLKSYFVQIGFQLEQGDDYFYFSRKEDKATMSRKIETAYKWIDILDFFKTFNTGFAPGFRFYSTQVVEEVRVNGLLRNKLNDIDKGKGVSARDQIEKILTRMEREGFIEKIDDFNDTWKVTAALHYMEQLILALDVTEDETDIKAEKS
ncbi:hypothetical protein G3O08_01915 [Cryomorpha ignava]|uniref:DUF4194 domain-containing protein n=1 Tax=Cryomorpha ignava TaxID=101383 RepID=A0A7K3WKT6_9FLAO|nr:hypothetical protein [Cryomorpha ignava]NEN22260.1 hypothetical protein [Cryomorpha ignava]